jgi:hypothetical protein
MKQLLTCNDRASAQHRSIDLQGGVKAMQQKEKNK